MPVKRKAKPPAAIAAAASASSSSASASVANKRPKRESAIAPPPRAPERDGLTPDPAASNASAVAGFPLVAGGAIYVLVGGDVTDIIITYCDAAVVRFVRVFQSSLAAMTHQLTAQLIADFTALTPAARGHTASAKVDDRDADDAADNRDDDDATAAGDEDEDEDEDADYSDAGGDEESNGTDESEESESGDERNRKPVLVSAHAKAEAPNWVGAIEAQLAALPDMTIAHADSSTAAVDPNVFKESTKWVNRLFESAKGARDRLIFHAMKVQFVAALREWLLAEHKPTPKAKGKNALVTRTPPPPPGIGVARRLISLRPTLGVAARTHVFDSLRDVTITSVDYKDKTAENQVMATCTVAVEFYSVRTVPAPNAKAAKAAKVTKAVKPAKAAQATEGASGELHVTVFVETIEPADDTIEIQARASNGDGAFHRLRGFNQDGRSYGYAAGTTTWQKMELTLNQTIGVAQFQIPARGTAAAAPASVRSSKANATAAAAAKGKAKSNSKASAATAAADPALTAAALAPTRFQLSGQQWAAVCLLAFACQPPPQIDDFDRALEHLSKRLLSSEVAADGGGDDDDDDDGDDA